MRNYVVIGGSSGIGEAIVNLLEQNGENVIATYKSNMRTDRSNVKYFSFNVETDDLVIDDFPEELHGLVYCPGSINLKPFAKLSEQVYKLL